jgi:hypothetical protein
LILLKTRKGFREVIMGWLEFPPLFECRVSTKNDCASIFVYADKRFLSCPAQPKVGMCSKVQVDPHEKQTYNGLVAGCIIRLVEA